MDLKELTMIVDGLEFVLQTGQEVQYGPPRPYITTENDDGTSFIYQSRSGEFVVDGPRDGNLSEAQLDAIRKMFLRYNCYVGSRYMPKLGCRWVRFPGDTITVGLVSCGGKKRDTASPARDLYIGDLFTKSKTWVEAFCDEWAILSAKHYLLMPDEVIEPYDLKLGDVLKTPDFRAKHRGTEQKFVDGAIQVIDRETQEDYERARTAYYENDAPKVKSWLGDCQIRAWANHINFNCYMKWGEDTHYVLLAGETYRRAFGDLNTRHLPSTCPLEGLGIGEQLSWLKKELVDAGLSLGASGTMASKSVARTRASSIPFGPSATRSNSSKPGVVVSGGDTSSARDNGPSTTRRPPRLRLGRGG